VNWADAIETNAESNVAQQAMFVACDASFYFYACADENVVFILYLISLKPTKIYMHLDLVVFI